MLKFNRNKNQTFKCEINVKGAGDSPNVETRLILSPDSSKTKLFFEGIYKNGKCEINIPPILDVEKSGNAFLEIIVNNTIFKPWKDTFEIISENVVVESARLEDNNEEIKVELINENNNNSKYIDILKSTNKTFRKKLLEKIQSKYHPNKKILEWGKNNLDNIDSLKSKTIMYCKENENKLKKLIQ